MKRKGFLRPVAAVAAAVLLISIAGSQAAWAQKKKVYRWVDEEGNVHYGESLPPDWEGETHDELRGDGIVTEEGISRLPPPPETEPEPDPDEGTTPLPRDSSGMERPEPRYSDAERQQRMDRLLILRYQSEDELRDAMELEINQLKYDQRLLNATRNSLEASLRSSIEVAANRQRAGLEVKQETLEEIAGIRSRLDENMSSLRGLKIREQNIRQSFNNDLQRYRELVEMYSEVEEES